MNASDFADAIADQWHDLYGPSRLEVPMSVLATAILRQHLVIPDEKTNEPHNFLAGQQRVWEAAMQRWPYLHHRWECFTDWPNWPDHHRATQAAAVFALRLRTMGVIEHLATLTHSRDFLGGVLYRLREPMVISSADPLSATRAAQIREGKPNRKPGLKPCGPCSHHRSGSDRSLSPERPKRLAIAPASPFLSSPFP